MDRCQSGSLIPLLGSLPEVVAEETAAEKKRPKKSGVEKRPQLRTTRALLTVPKLVLYEHMVRNGDSEYALDLVTIKLPSTDSTWQKGDTNSYIPCYRLG